MPPASQKWFCENVLKVLPCPYRRTALIGQNVLPYLYGSTALIGQNVLPYPYRSTALIDQTMLPYPYRSRVHTHTASPKTGDATICRHKSVREVHSRLDAKNTDFSDAPFRFRGVGGGELTQERVKPIIHCARF